MEHRAELRDKTITIKTVWDNHIPHALGMYPKHLCPKDSWFTKRVNKWEAETPYEIAPKDPLVKPWGNGWGTNPSRVSVLTALFGHAQEVLEDQDPNYRLEGFPKRVCNWAMRLSEFFDINSRRECLYLLRYAYRFEKDERIRMISPDPSDDTTISDRTFDDLIRWQQHKAGNLIRPRRTRELHQYKGPQSGPEITEVEEAYLWEETEVELEFNLAFDVRDATAFWHHGNGESELLVDDEWIPISIRPRYQQNQRPVTAQQLWPSSDVVPNKLLDELRSQGLPIDEDHAALGMVYTNPIEQEERSRAAQSSEETPIDQGYDAVYEAMWSPEEGN